MDRKIIGEKGFTLIELIITVAVLAMVSIPLFQYFTESAKHNARTITQQDTTLLAQDILEELKSEKIDITQPDFLTSGSGAATKSAINKDWKLDVGVNGAGEYTIKRQSDIDGVSYDVKAKITPVGKIENNMGSVTYYERQLPAMDNSKDIIATERSTSDIDAQMQFYGWYLSYCSSNNKPAVLKSGDFVGKLQKEINIYMKKESDTKVYVRVYYKYTYDKSKNGGVFPDGIGEGKSYEEDIIKKSVNKDKLSDFYLFYKPDISGKDIIKIDAASDLVNMIKDHQLNLFVVSQDISKKNNLEVKAGTAARYFKRGYTNIDKEVSVISDITFDKDDVTGRYYMVKREEKSRIADIKVSVYKGSKLCTEVNGSIVQK